MDDTTELIEDVVEIIEDLISGDANAVELAAFAFRILPKLVEAFRVDPVKRNERRAKRKAKRAARKAARE